jgi:hypothetical protein
MKTFTFTIALKCLFLSLFLFLACESGFSQTFLNVEPERIAEVIAEKYLNTGNPSNSVLTVSKIDAVNWSGRAIGYVVHYQPGGIAVIPVIKEINPLFAISGKSTGVSSEEKQVEIFFKEELERRYLAIVHKRISAASVQRNEKMWQQVLLADNSY